MIWKHYKWCWRGECMRNHPAVFPNISCVLFLGGTQVPQKQNHFKPWRDVCAKCFNSNWDTWFRTPHPNPTLNPARLLYRYFQFYTKRSWFTSSLLRIRMWRVKYSLFACHKWPESMRSGRKSTTSLAPRWQPPTGSKKECAVICGCRLCVCARARMGVGWVQDKLWGGCRGVMQRGCCFVFLSIVMWRRAEKTHPDRDLSPTFAILLIGSGRSTYVVTGIGVWMCDIAFSLEMSLVEMRYGWQTLFPRADKAERSGPLGSSGQCRRQ